jgi:hypothetical protein
VSGALEFFTNKEATKKEEVDVTAPAFSLTKVAGLMGVLIAAIGGATAKLEGATAVKVAAIGGAALVVAAFDLIVRQRASQAKLRYGTPSAGGKKPDGPLTLLPDSDDLVLQARHSSEEFEIKLIELDGEKATVVARHDGKTLTATFQPRS